MRTRRLLLASAALSTALLGACDKKKPVKYANDKSPLYDRPPVDAPTDAPDAGAETPPPTEPT